MVSHPTLVKLHNHLHTFLVPSYDKYSPGLTWILKVNAERGTRSSAECVCVSFVYRATHRETRQWVRADMCGQHITTFRSIRPCNPSPSTGDERGLKFFFSFYSLSVGGNNHCVELDALKRLQNGLMSLVHGDWVFVMEWVLCLWLPLPPFELNTLIFDALHLVYLTFHQLAYWSFNVTHQSISGGNSMWPNTDMTPGSFSLSCVV